MELPAPVIHEHDGIFVVRDDLAPGGTKARYLSVLFEQCDELVYASPAEGGAQTALAYCAQAMGKRATIFVAKRAQPHPRALMAKALGAKVLQVSPGYLAVVQKRAADYCAARGAMLAPFGVDLPEAIDAIAQAAGTAQLADHPDQAWSIDEVWCASGSGVLARGLAKAFPNARRHVVQVGRELSPDDVAGATIHIHPRKYAQHAQSKPPFPSDPHYDAKAWEICKAERGPGRVLFWNVTGPADH
ncbi:pyridoxal-phosphate dependent enzyme [Devosia ginsengisoli]|uniref:pyridoxal-phosphate dependent enzyme n=1 Tax=Devosia ginsengisoli TaxID=400770 RepID=UPI0026EAB259|nr:pyridoxal-phosphate dependent enzyme [Devosia ginsengisoli]MCR6673246.1 PLP-dependent lyase/thiolase [Devosia ginsengisoli]